MKFVDTVVSMDMFFPMLIYTHIHFAFLQNGDITFRPWKFFIFFYMVCFVCKKNCVHLLSFNKDFIMEIIL